MGPNSRYPLHCVNFPLPLTTVLEWKIEKDVQGDTHRHLSHLIGLYPGYALANYDSNLQALPNGTLSKADVLNATKTALISRGDGIGPDADAGWEKVWRAAAWAQLLNATEFYHILTVSYPEVQVHSLVA
jgi:alpha-L-fucosidase 2